jgi:DNA-binding NarL/FixJ family response regulator
VKNAGEGFRIKRREETLGNYEISDVELNILELLCEGLSTKEISKKMNLANGTIRNYRSSIYEKLNVRNRIEAIVKAYKIGLLELKPNLEKVKAILDDYPTSRLITLHYQLSPREIDLLELATTGKTNTELARELDISGGTVRNYFSSIYEKLDVNNKVEAVKEAIELGIIDSV